MKRLYVVFLILLALWPEVDEQHTIVRVVDGDTFVLDDGRRVRLYGVDCPELHQPYGDRAAELAKTVVLDRRVRITVVGRDRYGRLVGRVRVGDVDLGILLLRSGLAWWAHAYTDDREFVAAENYARRHRLGLWSDRRSIPPWTYRTLTGACRRCIDRRDKRKEGL